MALDRLRASLTEAPVVRFGEYEYFVHPITDGVPPGPPELLEEVAAEIARIGDWDCDKVVTAESMGFPLAAAVSLLVRKPYVFIRKRKYGLPGEVAVSQATGYGGATLYLNSLAQGDRVVLLDDVVSTGGTLRAVVPALRSLGVHVVDLIVVFDKMAAREALERDLSVRIKALMKVEVRDGRVVERP